MSEDNKIPEVNLPSIERVRQHILEYTEGRREDKNPTESYGPPWINCTAHANPKTGDIHCDGWGRQQLVDHCVTYDKKIRESCTQQAPKDSVVEQGDHTTTAYTGKSLLSPIGKDPFGTSKRVRQMEEYMQEHEPCWDGQVRATLWVNFGPKGRKACVIPEEHHNNTFACLMDVLHWYDDQLEEQDAAETSDG